MRTLAAALILLTLGLAPARAQEKPARAPGGLAICDMLLSDGSATRDRGAVELNCLDDTRAQELGAAILARPVLEARRLLGCVARAEGDLAVVAAIVCLDSPEAEIRSCALDAMMDAPLQAVRKAGDHHLKEGRRNTLRAMLMDKSALKPLCEGLPEVDGVPRAPVDRTLRLAILADRYWGSAGFTGLLRALGEIMVGEEDAPEPAKEDAEKPKKAGDEPDKAAELRAQARRLRSQAASIVGTIWLVEPGAQFNYEANAPLAARREAVNKLYTLLSEMESREIQLGQSKFKGVRLGDHLLGFSDARPGQFGQDVMEIVVASYMRLRWWKGEVVPLEGEGYSEAVAKVNEMGRRARSDMRKDLQRWWETYRNETERKQ